MTVELWESLGEALNEGWTERMFIQHMDSLPLKSSRWDRQVVPDMYGGELDIRMNSQNRLETLFHTYIDASYALVHYQSYIDDVDYAPFWQYDSINDTHTRPNHAALDGLVFRWDDPFWQSHYPPNGLNCRCRVRTLSQDDLDDEGLIITDGAECLHKIRRRIGVVESTNQVLFEDATAFHWRGKELSPDPGFSYNPGHPSSDAPLWLRCI